MRRIEVIFLKGRRIVFHDTPEDESTKRFTSAVWNYDPVLPITISAKTVVHINLRGGMNDSDERMNKIWEADRVKLIYRNTRNKLKSIMIQKKDYLHCFDSNSNIVDIQPFSH